MRLLLFSDVHRDLEAARKLVDRARSADVVVCAGDLATKREGLAEVVDVLGAIERPAVLVPGNGESDTELRAACAEWSTARVLHGSGCEIAGVRFWGLGGGVPETGFGSWSFDLDEERAAALLDGCPEGAVLVSHSPPFGHVDSARGGHRGSRSVLEAVRRARPSLVVCGHIHECWGQESFAGPTRVRNAGPQGAIVEV